MLTFNQHPVPALYPPLCTHPQYLPPAPHYQIKLDRGVPGFAIQPCYFGYGAVIEQISPRPGDFKCEGQRRLKVLGKWLSEEDTKFEKATDRFEKCIDRDLPEKLYTLLGTLEFAKGVGFPF